MPLVRPLPRLTGTLRAYSEVSAPERIDDENSELNLLAKRQQCAKIIQRRNSGASWLEIKAKFSDLKDPDQAQINRSLKKLIQLMKQILDSDCSEKILEDSACYVLKVFLNAEMIGANHKQKLHQIFGRHALDDAVLKELFALASMLLSWLSPDDKYELFEKNCADLDETLTPFGCKVKFTFFKPLEDGDSLFQLDKNQNHISSKDSFSLRYNKPIAPPAKHETRKEEIPKYTSQWVVHELNRGCDNITSNDIAFTVLQLLNSGKTNEELQDELCDLLGFDRLQLLTTLLEHRKEIVFNFQASTALIKEQNKMIPPETISKPTFGCQVTIQSEEEKMWKKHIRKEDKKNKKELDKNDSTGVNGFEYDPEYLRRQRNAQLLMASQTPLFSNKSSGPACNEVVNLPNVYDSFAKAKASSGYISGSKMVLPTNAERLNGSRFEEITIHAQDSSCIPVKQDLRRIDSLDNVCQLGFQGMKTLNLIQSLVFETAYKTNENMLICAPTGAGKTNIAMLTVLHQIKQHMEGSIVRREQFKIIYVAPMKALAAEMVRNFSKRLAPLGISVRELTGDMQPTKAEISQTQMLVTTPEKWDVVTRKSTGDVALTQLVKLLILDEVHLLHGDRGPVLEALVARTIRQVESSQSMIRIVGLSATLPNYLDIAYFLRVNPYIGLFFFDGRFRPVPLMQTFIGVKECNPLRQMQEMDDVCYQKVSGFVDKGHQVMVFVHARNATVRTAMVLKEMAQNKGHTHIFEPVNNPTYGSALKQMSKSRNKQLRELFPFGFGTHHAGMLRGDRNMVEKLFSDGLIKVLVCTATLAWGVNLPAHAVIIKGTEIYDSKYGSFVDLGILDVMQIFGRAGRPQFDKRGHGTIITSHDKLSHDLSLLTSQYPIESNFVASLTDNLNAEIALGTVSNVDEAVIWLSYTYLFIRMQANPLVYGIPHKAVMEDPLLQNYRRQLIVQKAKELALAQMIRFDETNGFFATLDKGRIASHFYIKHNTVQKFNEQLAEIADEAKILNIISEAEEFDQLKVRDDEMDELDTHLNRDCQVPAIGGSEQTCGKVNILLQSHISRANVDSFSLISDQAYVVQNSVRIMRALFEMTMKKNMAVLSGRILELCKMMERRQWSYESPLRQFPELSYECLNRLEQKNLTAEKMKDMDAKDIGHMIYNVRLGSTIKALVHHLPYIIITSSVQPITRTILRIKLDIEPDFNWNDRVHGKNSENFWIWVEGPNDDAIYHSEYFVLTKKQVVNQEIQSLVFTIPIRENLPPQYMVRAISDKWLGSNCNAVISFLNVKLPHQHEPITDLLDLQPLPVKALKHDQFEALYQFSHFNPIQTQLFHTLYHTDNNVLLGAPTGSGKTIVAEIAMFKVFRDRSEAKVVYIAPLKALVRERIEDWKIRFEKKLGLHVVELTGDATPDSRAIANSNVIVTTPEKWDGISRSWQTRNYVQDVALIVIDEIHLLGEDRGPVLEVIVSRTNFISAHTEKPLRVIGLSTAIANATDLAAWLNIKEVGLYNFRPSVRPVELHVHIDGYAGKHYCPRMALMNKPTYRAIQTHSPDKPSLVFVSSRRQTRLTALDLIAFLAAEDNPKRWMHLDDNSMESVLRTIRDQNLKLTLSFGIGLHHAGLHEKDRKTVEELFANQKIQVLIATATLAWGINLPAHLVVVKGTEFFDGKTRKYKDFPVTDVLQMVGRAGRPQFDNEGVAVVLVQDTKKEFYKKFLYDPFPVESCLLQVLPDHLNAEVVAGTISSKQDCLDYLTWTYFFRRLLQNPSYYQLPETSEDALNPFMSGLVDSALGTLGQSFCLEVDEDERTLVPTVLGRISSYYYLSHLTMRHFKEYLTAHMSTENVLNILTEAQEYAELPVRHNEDALNGELAKQSPIEVNINTLDSPHTKAHLLLQAHFGRTKLPSADYYTDLKSVLDQAIRIIQAMIDICADHGWLGSSLCCMTMLQMVLQASWDRSSTLLTLPHIQEQDLPSLNKIKWRPGTSVETLPELMEAGKGGYEILAEVLSSSLDERQIEEVIHTLGALPVIKCNMLIQGWWEHSEQEESKKISVFSNDKIIPDNNWVEVHADQEYVLNVKLRRINSRKRGDTKAITPKFPKSKDEGWFLVLGHIDQKELIAMKRVSNLATQTNQQLVFFTPKKPGHLIYTLYIMSDSYLGLDQQYDIPLNVLEVCKEAQLKSGTFIE